MFNSPLFPTGNNNQMKNSNNQKMQKKDQKPRSRLKTISMILVATGFIFYPFFIIGGLFFLIYKLIDREFRKKNIANMEYVTPFENHFPIVISTSIVLQILNIWLFISVIPRGYFSAYIYFPMNLLNTTLEFNHQTITALILGSIGAASWMMTASVAIDKRKVVSKEEKMQQVKQSKAYKKRQENKFNLAKEEADRYNLEYKKAKEDNDIVKLEELRETVYLGTDEFGFPYYMSFKELNQHLIAVGTTGAGKTTLLQIFIEHCIKFDIPILIFDGKGAKDTRDAVEKIAKMYQKEIKAFTDNGLISYNPVKYGNSVEVKDRLVELAKTESVFYSGASELLLMNTVQLIDHFGIKRGLKTLSNYFLPRNVLLLFAEEMLKKYPDLFTFPVEPKENKQSKKKKENAEVDQLDDELQQLNEEMVAIEMEETVTIDPETADLETVHAILRRSKYLLSEGSLRLFDLLFTRYEHKSNVFYLYATSESLQTNFNILLDSEIAKLFDTEANENELDLLEATRNGDVMYVALDGLIYTKFIKTLAQFFVSDINHLASERYEMTEDFPFAVLFDEPSAYLSFSFIDTVNKTRGAGVHAMFSPQTLADIEAIDPILLKQLIGNVNTYMVGQTNEPSEVDYWSSLFGTFEDIELTEMTEQEDGYSDVNKTDWVAERGTRRNVNKFTVKPDDIKKLRKGEYIVYRKGDDVQEPIVKVFMRKVT